MTPPSFVGRWNTPQKLVPHRPGCGVSSTPLETLSLARLVEVPDAGHTVPGDQPAAFLALLTDFLDRLRDA